MPKLQIILLWLFIVPHVIHISIVASVALEDSCNFEGVLSAPIKTILCSIETKQWRILEDSNAMKRVGCLIGQKTKCDTVMRVPTETDIPASPPPPPAKNKRYQELATIAESVVPKTWWREVRYSLHYFMMEVTKLTRNSQLIKTIGIRIGPAASNA